MIRLSKEELLKIARMAQIEISEDEIMPLITQMSDVLSYAERVQEFVAGKKIAEQVSFPAPHERDDVPQPVDSKPLLAQAPRAERSYFVVPVIIEQPKGDV